MIKKVIKALKQLLLLSELLYFFDLSSMNVFNSLQIQTGEMYMYNKRLLLLLILLLLLLLLHKQM